MDATIYSLYKTTNLVNGKIYIGIHKESKWPNIDSYLGSGIALKAAIREYGKHNFQRQVLCISDSVEYIQFLESCYVNKEFIYEDTNYNICGGGSASIINEETKKKISLAKQGVPLTESHKQNLRGVKKQLTQEQREILRTRAYHQFKGMRRRNSNRLKVSLAKRGKLNPMWGRKPANAGVAVTDKQKKWLSQLNNQKKRRILLDGVEYQSLCEASKVLNLHTSTISNRLSNPNYPEWYYLDSPIANPSTQLIWVMGQRFPSIRQAAMRLGIHRHTILRWLRDPDKEDCYYDNE